MGRGSLRNQVWEEDPHCYNCGRLTVLVTPIRWDDTRQRFIRADGGPFPEDMASGWGVAPPPGSPPGTKGRIVILCRRCKGLERRIDMMPAPESEDYEALLATSPHQLNRSKRNKRKRLLLWLEDPRCRECGQVTVLVTPVRFIPHLGVFGPSGASPDNTATLEHVYSRLNPKRQTERGILSLSCAACNSRENNQRDVALYSSPEDQWRRGGREPLLKESQR